MKKYILFSLIFTLIFPNITFGFLSDPLGLDMYKKIDKGLYDLELKYLEKELKGGDVGGSIADDLNKRAKVHELSEKCFKGNMSASDVEKMNHGDLTIFNKYIDPTCKDQSGAMSIGSVDNYLKIIQGSYQENSKKAETKVDNLYKIGRIGMYSDGIDENSPFDLMSDIKEIDRIIFEEEIPYNGVNTADLGMVTDGILNGLSMNEAMNLGGYKDHIMFQGKYKQNDYTDPESSIIDGNNQICTTNESGLDSNSIQGIIDNVKNNSNQNSPSSSSGNNTSNGIINEDILNNSGAGGGYAKVNDNSMWPCNNFFCITIQFVTYNHNLLGGGSNLSIEGLFKRSNEHFKKVTSTSMIQSRMTTNLFELGLKDLNLPDIFHVGTQVSYKPVPLLDIEKDGKDKDTDEFKYKNMLTRYYRNLGLDYERSNDLSIFRQKEAEFKSVIDSAELPQIEAEEKKNNFQNHLDIVKKENNFVSTNIIDKKVIQDDMQDFYKQFIELESFTNAMLDYTIGAGGIVKKMNEIPRGN